MAIIKQALYSPKDQGASGKRRAGMSSFRGAPKIANVSANSSKDFAMTYSAVTRIDIAPFGLLLIAAVILVSCSTSRTETPTAEAAPPPLTQSKAAEQCWMETEHGAKSLPAEKRAKVVDQCVKDKMSGAK
jgi:hypothetical protein